MNTTVISHENILDTAHKMFCEKYRLVQICATRVGEELFLDYSFGRDYDFVNYKCQIDANTAISSISHVFPSAFLYENEMHDLYGIEVRYMTVDYEGSFYRTAVKNPFFPLKQEEE